MYWPSFCIEDGEDKQWYPYGEFPREYTEQVFAELKIEVENYLNSDGSTGAALPF